MRRIRAAVDMRFVEAVLNLSGPFGVVLLTALFAALAGTAIIRRR